MNPRYIAFAHSQGRTGIEQLAFDREQAASMLGYLLWLPVQLRTWASLFGHRRALDPYAPLSRRDHAGFDRWLEATYPPPSRSQP